MTNPINNDISDKDCRSFLVILFSTLFLESLSCLAWLFSIPSSPGGLIFGLSLNRLILISPLLISVLFNLAILLFLFFRVSLIQKRIKNFFTPNITRIIFIVAVILSVASWCILFFFNLLNYVKFQYISERSLPLITWCVVTGITILAGLHYSSKGNSYSRNAFDLRLFVPILFISIVLFVLPPLTGIGLHTRDITVNDLGVPLLEWQIVFTIGLLILLAYTKAIVKNKEPFNKGKIETIKKYLPSIFFTAIWLSAFIFWLNQPLPINNYFAPKVLPPNFETYPFSDAERYSLDSIRIINGLTSNFIISKPFHAIYLAALNFFGRLNYQNVIFGQTLILAFFPSVLFLIGKEIRGNLLGLGMGIFTIFREVNAIQASNIANVANSKLLLSDFPSTLILSVIILLMLKWIKNPQVKKYPIFLGGILGILILYRAQYLIFIPVFIVIAFFLYWKDKRRIVLFSGIFVLCLSAIILPLLFRNYSISGFFWFDSSNYLSGFKESYVLADPENINSDISQQEPTLPLDQPGDQLGLVQSLIRSNYLVDISDNFFRNLISTFLVFPIRMDGSQDLQQLSVIKDNFWSEAYQYNSQMNLLIAIFNLVLFIIGVYMFVSTDWIVAVSLILIYLTQNLSSALFRFSGWRFIMPVDWMVLFIYIMGILGLFEILRLIPRSVQMNQISYPVPQAIKIKQELKIASPFLLAFLLIGSILPIRELFPAKDHIMSKSEICSYLETHISREMYPQVRMQAIQLCNDESITAQEGEMIYPRFFERGQGFYDNPSDVFYGKQDFSRLMFRFSVDDIRRLYLPLNEIKDNLRIVNGSRAIILAKTNELPKVQLILLKNKKDILLVSDELLYY